MSKRDESYQIRPGDAPAFPFQHDDRTHVLRNDEGLSKRELIAAMMAQGLASNGYISQAQVEDRNKGVETWGLPQMAVQMADALIAELAKDKS